jgi:hypothetical protein
VAVQEIEAALAADTQSTAMTGEQVELIISPELL